MKKNNSFPNEISLTEIFSENNVFTKEELISRNIPFFGERDFLTTVLCHSHFKNIS